jgi:hypothetical protein
MGHWLDFGAWYLHGLADQGEVSPCQDPQSWEEWDSDGDDGGPVRTKPSPTPSVQTRTIGVELKDAHKRQHREALEGLNASTPLKLARAAAPKYDAKCVVFGPKGIIGHLSSLYGYDDLVLSEMEKGKTFSASLKTVLHGRVEDRFVLLTGVFPGR